MEQSWRKASRSSSLVIDPASGFRRFARAGLLWTRSRPGTGQGGTPIATAQKLDLPWGPGSTLSLELPVILPAAESEVSWPDLSRPLDDYAAALSAAVESPEESAPPEQLVGAGSTVAIVVDDPSRWTPVRDALPIILGRLLAAGVRAEDV